MHYQPSLLTVAPSPAAYSAFFTCFNDGQYFEAHEVLEELWLEVRHDADGSFYKGLIQLAAAFLHWHEGRPGPAASLLRTAGGHLARYPERHHGLDVARVRRMASAWADDLVKAASSGQPLPCEHPRLEFELN